jgi:hypothetical protein
MTAVAVAVGDNPVAASALAAALARSALSIGSMPLEIGNAVATAASDDIPEEARASAAMAGAGTGAGPLSRNAGSTTVPGRGT